MDQLAKIAELEEKLEQKGAELEQHHAHLATILKHAEPFKKYLENLKSLDWPNRPSPDSPLFHLGELNVTRQEAENLLLALTASKTHVDIMAMIIMAKSINWGFGVVAKHFEEMKANLKNSPEVKSAKAEGDIDYWIGLFIETLNEFSHGTNLAAIYTTQMTLDPSGQTFKAATMNTGSGEPHVEPTETV